MVYQRMFRSVMLLCFAGIAFAACSSGEPQTPQEKYCTAKCNCNKCTPNESATCLDDLVNLEAEARAADCKDPYETYLTCLNADGECVDGDFDESPCFNEETDLKSCIKPPPVCATANNGKCNEPAPAGDGTCAAGTDTKDCMASTCPTAGDGFCDEPEGSGTCAEGTDPIDCPAQACQSCFQYLQNPSGGSLCTTSTSKYAAYYQCACDTNKCSPSCSSLDDVCSVKPASAACLNCVESFDAVCTAASKDCLSDTPPP